MQCFYSNIFKSPPTIVHGNGRDFLHNSEIFANISGIWLIFHLNPIFLYFLPIFHCYAIFHKFLPIFHCQEIFNPQISISLNTANKASPLVFVVLIRNSYILMEYGESLSYFFQVTVVYESNTTQAYTPHADQFIFHCYMIPLVCDCVTTKVYL